MATYCCLDKSADENAWVLANVSGSQDAWIALRQDVGPQYEPNLGWYWMLTYFVPYTNWCSGQPDDGGATEWYLVPHQRYGMFTASGALTLKADCHILFYRTETLARARTKPALAPPR